MKCIKLTKNLYIKYGITRYKKRNKKGEWYCYFIKPILRILKT